VEGDIQSSRMALRAYAACEAGDEQDAKAIFERLNKVKSRASASLVASACCGFRSSRLGGNLLDRNLSRGGIAAAQGGPRLLYGGGVPAHSVQLLRLRPAACL